MCRSIFRNEFDDYTVPNVIKYKTFTFLDKHVRSTIIIFILRARSDRFFRRYRAIFVGNIDPN